LYVTIITSRSLLTALLQLSEDEAKVKHIIQERNLIYRRKSVNYDLSHEVNRLTLQCPNSNGLAEVNFTENVVIFEFQEQQLDVRRLQRTNIGR